MRLREQVRALAPLGRSKVSAVLWAEPFISVYRTNVARKTFDQLRLFAGLTLPLSKEVDAEFGYLRQHLHRSGGDIENNAFPFVLNVRL